MSEKTIVLPNREEMLRRLMAVSSEPHYRDRLYPLLLRHAGEKRVVQGLVRTFALAVSEYASDLLPVRVRILYKHVPGFIDALVDDKEMANEAKSLWPRL